MHQIGSVLISTDQLFNEYKRLAIPLRKRSLVHLLEVETNDNLSNRSNNVSRLILLSFNPLILESMSGTAILDHYNSNHEGYKQKLQEKLEQDQRNGSSSFLDTIEELRQEQRIRLAQVEHDYYNQQASVSLNGITQEKDHSGTLVTSKPPIPKASRQSPSPVLHTEERAQYHVHHRPNSSIVIRRHDEEIAFCPHRTPIGNTTTTVHDLTTEHMKKQIQSMWKEFELEDYLEEKK